LEGVTPLTVSLPPAAGLFVVFGGGGGGFGSLSGILTFFLLDNFVLKQ
jgi:uncharacterized membrane protein